MRILVFAWKDIKHPWAGGSEVNILEQARRWTTGGHQVTMFTSRFGGTARRDCIDGVEVFRAGGRFTVFLAAPIFYLFSLRHRADVVIDIINGIPFSTPLYSRKPIVGLVHHVHREMFVIELGPLLGRFGRSIEQYVLPVLYRNKPFICVSESTARAMRTMLFRGKHLDISIVHNGVSFNHYRSEGFQKFEKPTVLYLGRLKKYKQLPRLITIMSKVRQSVPDAELIVAGWGDAGIEAKETVERLDASGYVKFTGFLSDEEKTRHYQQAWVLATASMVEGWGLTVIEANACGTPAVSFNVPGLDESILEGKTGRLANDDAEFAQALVDILSNERLRESLSAGASEWASNFSWDKAADESLAILKKALETER